MSEPQLLGYKPGVAESDRSGSANDRAVTQSDIVLPMSGNGSSDNLGSKKYEMDNRERNDANGSMGSLRNNDNSQSYKTVINVAENPETKNKNDEVLSFMMKDTGNSSNHGDKQSNHGDKESSHGDKESNHGDKDSSHGDKRNIVTNSVNADEIANGNKEAPHRNKTVISGAGRVTPADITSLEMEQKNGSASKNGPDKLPDKGGNSDKGSNGKSEDEKKKDEPQQLVGFFEVFKYAKGLDIFLMLLGTLCAACHGAAFPGMIIVFGEMIDLFVGSGKFQNVINGIAGCGLLPKLNTTESALLKEPAILMDTGIQAIIRAENCTNFNFDQELVNINDAVTRDLLDTMRQYAIWFTVIGCGVIVLGYGQVTFWMLASERQTHRIRSRFFRNILRQNIGWFDLHESGELNTRLSDDISKIHDGIGDKLGSFFQWFCGFLAGFIVGFIWGWKLTLVILAISPLLAGSAFVMTKLVALASASELKAYAKAGAIAEEVLGGIRTVVAFGGQKKECARYNENLTDARDLGIRKALVNGFTMGLVWFIIFGAYALGFWYGSKLAREESVNYTIGDVMIVFFAVLIAAFSLGNAAPNIQSFGVARGAAYTIYNLIELNPPIDSYSEQGEKPDHMDGNIEFRDVHFKYPSRPDVPVLNGVSLKINRGQIVALVGSSGCGKSTMVQLIQRFYDAERGSVKIDGRDIKDINIKWLRQRIGIVSQEPVLFGTTIAENIRYGREDATREDIENSAKMANAHDFIMKLPDKYETLVGERGAQLSGGQKQRVAIARALIRDPKILLLDEATSALDTESEGIVQDALEKASHGRTTIVIAHRLSTIKNADMIAGFKDGVIAEVGTHNELMSKQGIYNSLVTQQTKLSEDDEEAERFEEAYAKKPELQRLKSQIDHHTPIKRATSIKKKEEEEGEADKDKDKEKKKEVDASLKRILRINASEWVYILLGCLGSMINGGVMPAFAIIFAEIIGVFSEPDPVKQEREIMMYCLIFLGIGAISLVAMFLQGYMFGRSGEYLTLRLRQMSFKAMLRQEISWYDDHDNSVGALTTRLATDASQVQGAAGIRLGSTIMSCCSMLTGVIIAFIYGWKLTLVILCFVPALAVAGALQMKMLTGAAGKNREALEQAGKVAVESIENIRTVASLTREEVFYRSYMFELNIPYRQALKKAHVIGITFSFSQAIVFFAYAASFYYGAVLIEDNEMEYVDVFKVFSAVVFGAMAIGQASSFAPDASKAQASAVNIFTLLDSEPLIDSENTEGLQLRENEYSSAIKFSSVNFRYPTRPDVQVLNGLNLSIEPGNTVALVGSSGCGKSTTVQLIERFYDPEGGEVCIDKHNIKDLNLQWLRSQVGIVSQEPVLFDRSIAENIAYGDNSRTVPMDEIINAARNSNIHEFISSLPEGYDTNVGEKGAQLSGGQKQRVAIARALVRNPKILLLDEATSALDTESEKVVQEALDKAREGRTSIVIAHRLSTIQNADKICVIRHGVVTEEGKHNDLMKNQGFYYKLNMAQARKK